MSDHSAHEAAVLGMLRGRSSDDALPMPILAAALGVSTRVVQQVVKHLIERHAEPIGSTCRAGRSGYFYVHTGDDLARAERDLKHRAISVLQRLARLKAATPDEVLGQLRLEWAGDTEAS